MTLGRALKTGGFVGVIVIVVSFYVWFLLSKLRLSSHCYSMGVDKFFSGCYSGVHGGYQCNVALAQIGMG